MRFLRTTSTARLLALVIGVTVVAAATAAIALAATSGGGSKPPSKPLAQAIHDALTAPQVDGVTARVKFVNHLVDSSALPNSTPLLSGASGRLWASSDGKLRIELQSDSGDVQVVTNGKSFLVYDGSSNTAYTGDVPRDQGPPHKQSQSPPSVRQIQKGITHARQHATVSGAIPTVVGGQSAYEVRVVPQHRGLVSGVRAAWDAVHGIPLKIAIYARGNGSPVLSLSATRISFGKVSSSAFAITPPKGAHVENLTGHSSAGGTKQPLSFTPSTPATLVGKARQQVKHLGSDGVLATYGQGLDGIAVIEKKSGGQSNLALPTTVSINGVTGQELPTALGTVVRFTRGGVEYTVLGSQPTSTVLAAARAL